MNARIVACALVLSACSSSSVNPPAFGVGGSAGQDTGGQAGSITTGGSAGIATGGAAGAELGGSAGVATGGMAGSGDSGITPACAASDAITKLALSEVTWTWQK